MHFTVSAAAAAYRSSLRTHGRASLPITNPASLRHIHTLPTWSPVLKGKGLLVTLVMENDNCASFPFVSSSKKVVALLSHVLWFYYCTWAHRNVNAKTIYRANLICTGLFYPYFMFWAFLLCLFECGYLLKSISETFSNTKLFMKCENMDASKTALSNKMLCCMLVYHFHLTNDI